MSLQPDREDTDLPKIPRQGKHPPTGIQSRINSAANSFNHKETEELPGDSQGKPGHRLFLAVLGLPSEPDPAHLGFIWAFSEPPKPQRECVSKS